MEKSKQDYIFVCENGKTYGIPKDTKCCLICKHCKDIWYDYMNGPYMFFCNLNEDTNECMNCNSFELQDGTMTIEEYEEKVNSSEYIEKQKRIEEEFNRLINDKHFVEKMQKMFSSMIIPTVSKRKGLFKKLKKESEEK